MDELALTFFCQKHARIRNDGKQDIRHWGVPMNRAKLRYVDGHEEVAEEFDPTTTTIVRQTADGKYHHFRATDEIDEDGCDAWTAASDRTRS